MTKETIDLYPREQYIEIDAEITAMAMRFHIKHNDVICALWAIAKDSVWAKLTQDRKALEEEFAREKVAMSRMEATNAKP